MKIPRRLEILPILQKKSCFLFGPRQTGKTFLIREHLSQYRYYNLLESETYLSLNHSPQRLREAIQSDDKIVIIDEIQRIPELLNEVHILIEEKGIHFLLTGSSARKLRRQGVNLLGGRAWTRHLHPLTYPELGENFNLDRALNRGLLPSMYFSEDYQEELAAYAGNYLHEEIAIEAQVRNVGSFSRFLFVAGLCNSNMINYSNIASDTEVSQSTVQEYFQILKDTLLAHELPAWRASQKRKALATSKFYLFDTGVTRFLQNRSEVLPGSPEYGDLFESYLHHELRAYCDYSGRKELHYWRSTSGFEVDFILNHKTAIEVKAKAKISKKELKGLRALKEEGLLENYLLVSLEKEARHVDGIDILPWELFLQRLWNETY